MVLLNAEYERSRTFQTRLSPARSAQGFILLRGGKTLVPKYAGLLAGRLLDCQTNISYLKFVFITHCINPSSTSILFIKSTRISGSESIYSECSQNILCYLRVWKVRFINDLSVPDLKLKQYIDRRMDLLQNNGYIFILFLL